jgi:hypothetical protein
MSDEKPLPFPVTAAVKPADVANPYTIQTIAALVRDLAMNMYDLDYILVKHGLTQDEYDGLRENEFFKRAMEVAATEWNSPMSTNKRLAMQAAIGLEDAMPVMAARMLKNNEPVQNIIEIAKIFTKIAGVGEDKAAAVPTEKFHITIDLGGDIQRFEKNRPLQTIQSQPEGAGPRIDLSAEPEGDR